MAKKLNKKIAIIGLLVLLMLGFAVIIGILKFSKNPQQYIKDAHTALALKEPDYKTAEKAYGRAFAYAKKDINLKIDILFELVDMYINKNEWPKAAGCWNKIINFDTKNLKARLALLDYNYQVALSGNWTLWKDVESNASELIEKELDVSPRMYRIKGQALLELVKRGQMTDKEKSINDAIAILQKTNQDEPNNVDTYQYIADAIIQKGEILAAKGILNAADNARQEADKILQKGVENNPADPRAYINLYSNQLLEAKDDQDKVKKIESGLIQLTEKFPDSSLSFAALSQLYQKNPNDIDKAIASVEKARQLDKQNVSYALSAANMYYRKSMTDNDRQNFQKGVDIATGALIYPDSLDIPGPKARISFINRYSLHNFLANCYLDRTTNDVEKNTKTGDWQELAEKEIYQINQLLGSAENPYSVMWQGRLLLAKGEKNEAIRQMYNAYQKLTTASQTPADPQIAILAYELAKAFEGTGEPGAVGGFYLTAFNNGMYYSKPQMLLDFASSLMRIRDWKHSLDLIDIYEKNFGESNKSRELRLSAYIGGNMYEQAQEKLANLSEDDPNILRFKNLYLNSILSKTGWEIDQKEPNQQDTKQNEQYQQLKAKYEQTKKESNRVRDKLTAIGSRQIMDSEFVDMCKRYIADKEYNKANSLVDNFLLSHPNSVNASIYKIALKEPSPDSIAPERNDQIMLQAFETVKEPLRRQLLLGQYYQAKGQSDQAIKYYQEALQIAPDNALAITNLFDVAIGKQDFSSAEKLIGTATKNNTDLCDGEFFMARLAYAKKDYQTLVEKLNNCLEKRPVFSKAYLLRSQAYTAMGKEDDAIADARKAFELNPYDNIIPRNLAYVLYNRNMRLGNGVTADQITETRGVLETAMRANPADVDLINFYAKYISTAEPDRAIAVSQQIQKKQPTIENSIWLGSLAMDVAKGKASSQKNTYYELAQDAYKKAYAMGPNDVRVLDSYAECLRIIGKPGEGEKILAGHSDLLWRFYIRNGKVDDAQKILGKLYEANPSDVNNIKGLLLIARNKNDQASILKYTAELVKIDKSLENQIIQIESCLEMGLSDEAKSNLESLREKYPDEPRLIFLQTWLIARQGKLAEALKLANRNLELDNSNPRVWRLRGQINTAMGSYNDAISDFQKSKSLSDNAEVRIDIARTYANTNEVEQAISELKIAADEQGSSVAREMLEEMYYKIGNVERLDKFYSEMTGKFPDSVYWLDRAGDFALKTKNFDKAYKLFDTAFQNSAKINSETPDIDAFDGKMKALLLSKKYDQLQAEATKYLDGPFAPIAYERMAEAKAYTGEKDTALQYFKRALEKAGTNEDYVMEILRLMNSVAGSDETIKWCNEKLQSQPDSLPINFVLFNLYSINQQYNKAIEYIDNCLRISVKDEQIQFTCQVKKSELLLKMFEKTSDKEYLEKAIKEYESMLQKQPTNVRVMNNLAYILADNNIDMGKSLEYGQMAYQTAPNNAGILDTYGYVLMKNNKMKEADEFFYRSIQQFEQNKMSAPIEVYEHMALVKEKLGQNDKAIEVYKRALESAGNNISPEVKNRITAAIERLSASK